MQTPYGRLTLQFALACLSLGFVVLFLACFALTLMLFSPLLVFQLLTAKRLLIGSFHQRGSLTKVQF
jgi:hypothetical protein